MTDDAALRDALLRTAQSLNPLGLNRGKAGNVSVRCADGLLITPSALPYHRMQPADMVLLGLDGAVRAGTRAPSTEWHFHCAIYRERSDTGAIVHTHGPFSTTLACLDRDIPAFHYMVAKAGGTDIRCARYATFGTPELAAQAVAALRERQACLLSRHGMIALGRDLDAALAMAIDVEALAEVYWRVLQIGAPASLDAKEMARVHDKFAVYGMSGSGDSARKP